jgi:hypothetical protein
MKDAAATLTQLTDDVLDSVMRASKDERRRMQREAESSRG